MKRRWRYDNSGFNLAGMVIERVTEQDYGAYLREHLFKPLGFLADAKYAVATR